MFSESEILNLSVALYSKKQNCYHIESLLDYAQVNLRGMNLKEDSNNFRLIGAFNSDLEAHEYIATVRKKIEEFKERERNERQDNNI